MSALAFKLAWRSLRAGARDLRLMLLCLFLGVASIAVIGEIRAAVLGAMDREAQAMLGGDASLRLTYRQASAQERRALSAQSGALSEVVHLRSLVHFENETALTEVKAVDAAYPLVGEVMLSPPMPLAEALADHGAVLAPILADRLGLKIGDRFTLGEAPFTLRAFLERAPDDAGGEIGFGPRALVGLDDLKGAGLLREGTLFSADYRLLSPAPELRATLAEDFAQSGFVWTDQASAPEGAGAFVARLADFMVLIALAGLMIGGVGIAAAVSAYLAERLRDIAILRTLGATKSLILTSFGVQIGAVTLLGIGAGLAVGALVPIALAPRLPVEATFKVYPLPLLEAALYGLLTAALFTALPLLQAARTTSTTLLRTGGASSRAGDFLKAAPFAAALAGAAAAFSSAPWLTLGALLGLALVMLLLTLAAFLLQKLLRALRPLPLSAPWRLALAGASQPSSRSTLVALGLGLTVMASIAQIEGNLQRALAEDLPTRAPSYFVLDLQPDQMPAFLDFAKDPSLTRVETAPMLRGLITHINGQPAAEWPIKHWALVGDRGISMAEAQPANTRLTAGQWWEPHSPTPEISFSAAEAEALGLGLGDTLTLNVLGRDITAPITSLRRVNFQSAGMGFVLLLNPAALKGAPYSNIATLYAPEAEEARLLRSMAQSFPNITAIRVKDVIEAAARVLTQIGSAAQLTAMMVLLTGALVLIGTAAAGQTERAREAALLKTLGATKAQIARALLLRAGLSGAVAGGIALAAAIGASHLILTEVLNLRFVLFWDSLALVLVLGIALSIAAQLLFLRASLGTRPAATLRHKD